MSPHTLPKNVHLLGRLRNRQTAKLDSEPHSPHTPRHTRSKLMASHPLTKALWPSKTDAASPPHTKKHPYAHIPVSHILNHTALFFLGSFFFDCLLHPSLFQKSNFSNRTSLQTTTHSDPHTASPISSLQTSKQDGGSVPNHEQLIFPLPSSTPPLQ